MKHLVFIINPKSGVDRQKKIQNAIDQFLDHVQYSYELQYTQFAKHGTELAKQAACNGAYAVVAVGGDGSLNDIAKGLLGTNTILAVIPKGSGNGMARTLGIPINDVEAIKLINRGNTSAIDVAFANDVPYISNAGIAFDALIAKEFAKSEKRGLMSYSWLVTKHMWTYKEWKWKIEIDGKEIEEEAFIINVANGRQFGYDFKIAPDANWTDGLLDVILIRKFPKILGGIVALRLKLGSIHRCYFSRHFRTNEITISHPDLKLIQTDGDAHSCANSIHFSIKPAALRVIVP